MAEMDNTSPEMQEQNVDSYSDPFEFEAELLELTDDDRTDEQAADVQEAHEEQKYTVKYNGEEQQLSLDELITHAQKGMNYDKVKGERDSLREGKVYKAMQAYAAKAGMSVDAAAQYLLESDAADAELAEEEAIRNEYGNLPDGVLRELVSSRTAAKRQAIESKAVTEEEKAWQQALDAYPSLTMDSIPDAVRDAVAKGESPLMALRNNEIAELRKQLKEKETENQNNLNRAKSVGSVHSAGTVEQDPFLQGFGY